MTPEKDTCKGCGFKINAEKYNEAIIKAIESKQDKSNRSEMITCRYCGERITLRFLKTVIERGSYVSRAIDIYDGPCQSCNRWFTLKVCEDWKDEVHALIDLEGSRRV